MKLDVPDQRFLFFFPATPPEDRSLLSLHPRKFTPKLSFHLHATRRPISAWEGFQKVADF